jgi:hypothetical protein
MGNHRPEDIPAGLVDALRASTRARVSPRRDEMARVRRRLATIRLDDAALHEQIAASLLVESAR